MVNVAFPRAEDYNDVSSLGDYRAMVASGVPEEEALRRIAPKSRDNARTPYPWNGGENGGFTTGTPWLKMNPTYPEINLEADRKSPDSVFAYYQKLIALRREHPSIIDGKLEFLLENHPRMIVYLRKCKEETLLVIANKSDEEVPVEMPEGNWTRILTNREETEPSLHGRKVWLPWEAEVYVLNKETA